MGRQLGKAQQPNEEHLPEETSRQIKGKDDKALEAVGQLKKRTKEEKGPGLMPQWSSYHLRELGVLCDDPPPEGPYTDSQWSLPLPQSSSWRGDDGKGRAGQLAPISRIIQAFFELGIGDCDLGKEILLLVKAISVHDRNFKTNLFLKL